jgi:hypothetical protein
MARVPLQRGAALHLRDHGGVEPHADVEEEVPAVHRAEADAAARVAIERSEQLARGLDGVVGHADGAREHVGRPARHHTQRGARPRQAVGRLVQRAVTSEDHHGVDVTGGGVLGQPERVPAPARLGDGDVVVGRERLADHDARPGRHRRR